MREGLLDDTVLQILEDDAGQVMGTRRGIACVSKAELEDLADGKTSIVSANLDETRRHVVRRMHRSLSRRNEPRWQLWPATLKGGGRTRSSNGDGELTPPTIIEERC